MLRKAFLGLAFGLAASCACAQTAPSPADVGISKGTPDVFKLKGHDNAWTPFGSVDPSTHIYVPATNGAIAPNDCVKWGPGLTSAGAACNSITGGATPANQLTIYTNHSGLVNNVTTPTEAWTVQQQGFYAPGDGGAATYQWSLTSYCGGTSGSPVTADGINCILPIGQSPSTAGRYLFQNNGSIDVRQVGMQIGGADNSPYVAALMAALGPTSGNGNGPEVIFPALINKQYTAYYFSSQFTISRIARYRCGSGRGANYNGAELVFAAGMHGVVQEDGSYTSDGQYGGGAVDGCAIVSLGRGSGAATPGASTITGVVTSQDPGGFIPASVWHVGDGIIATPACGGCQTNPASIPAVQPGAYVSGVSGSTLTLASGYTVTANLNTTYNGLAIFQLPAALKFTVQTTAGSGTAIITAGPRPIVGGEVIWSDAFPIGATVLTVDNRHGFPQTVQIFPSYDSGVALAALVTHPSGSPGQLWVVPSGLRRDTLGNSSNNVMNGFGIGLQMSCSSANPFNCTGSYDDQNLFFLNLVGRWTAGNNTSASSSINEKGSGNYWTDYFNGGTLGETDINFNGNSAESGQAYWGVMGNCISQNASVMLGGYVTGTSGGCVDPVNFFPPTPGSPWVSIGLASGTMGTGGPVITNGEFFGSWIFADWNNDNHCLGIQNGALLRLSHTQCATIGSMTVDWKSDTNSFDWVYNGNADIMRQFGEEYLGYLPPYEIGGIVATQGLEIGASNDYTGQERLLDGGSSAPNLPRLMGDVRFNRRPDLTKNLGWINAQAFSTTLAAAVTAGTTMSVAVAACPSPALPAGTPVVAVSNVNAPPIVLDQVLGTLASCAATTLTLNAASAYNSASGTQIQFTQWRPTASIANDAAGTSVPIAAVTDIADLVACGATTVGFGVVNNGVAVGTGGYGAAVSATGSSTRPVFCDGTSWTYH